MGPLPSNIVDNEHNQIMDPQYIHYKRFLIVAMSEIIRDYFRRFDNSVSESVYSKMTMLDYQRNKAVNEFLDYDKDTIFRKNKHLCGVRNIDNTCYLSVTVQLLYNIQSLREKVFIVPQNTQNKFIKELQVLFAIMLKGSLCYVDPTQLFKILKQTRPDVFVPGSQNDFHEVFTLVLEELEKGMPTQEDKRFVRKIFYGKSRVSIMGSNHSQSQNQNIFNIINLSSKAKSFDRALAESKKQKLLDYVDEKGLKINAELEVDFLETPALLTCFINRVEYRDKKLMKDSSEFEFQEKIFLNKKNLKSNVKNVHDGELQKQELNLSEWIRKVEHSREILAQSLSYLEGKEFEEINLPNINNPKGEEFKEYTKAYLKAQIQQIELKIKEVKVEIEEIKMKRIKLAEENYSQLYTMYAVMIHCGKTAESGHYKLCILINGEWIEFNDRRTEVVKEEKIKEYKRKGEICCLFYRRSTLICQSEKMQVPATLKKLVQEEQKKVCEKIDQARILQSLYQEYETVSLLYEFEMMSIAQNPYNYFFKPLAYLLKGNCSVQTCRGYLLYEMIHSEKFMLNLKEKLITDMEVMIPPIKFGIPDEYLSLSEGLREFLNIEMMNDPVKAYDLIAFYMDISMNDETVKKEFQSIREIITFKGIFYESLLISYGLMKEYKELARYINKLMDGMNQESTFVLVFVPIRDELAKKGQKEAKISGCFKKKNHNVIDNYGEAFLQRFMFEISKKGKLEEVDETILKEFEKLYPKYMISIN